jgi:hypothetical protein
MIPRKIQRSVFRDHRVHLLSRTIGVQVLKEVVEMAADVPAKKVVRDVGRPNNALDRAADIGRGVEQSPVHIEEVDLRSRDHGNTRLLTRTAQPDAEP